MRNPTSLDLRRLISASARRHPCFLYTPQNRRLAAEIVRPAHQPEKQARLAKVLEDELGHDLSFAVVRGQIAASGRAENASILLDWIESGLAISFFLMP